MLCTSSAVALSPLLPSSSPLYHPETEMENPPLVVRDITSREQLEAIKDDAAPPQYALFTIASVRDHIMVTVNGSSFTVEDIFAACQNKTVPVFNISNVQPSAPGNLIDVTTTNHLTGFIVISTEPETLNKFAEHTQLLGMDCGLIAESADQTAFALANECGASFIFTASATKEQVSSAVQSNLKVMLNKGQQNSGQAMQEAIDAGAKWVVVSDHAQAYDKLPALPFAEPPHMPDLPMISFLGLTDFLVPLAAVLLIGSVLIATFYRKRRR